MSASIMSSTLGSDYYTKVEQPVLEPSNVLRRASVFNSQMSTTKDGYENIKRHWWNDYDIVYAIRESNVRARLEHLMKSNLVRMSNRKYMQELQDKIREDFIKTMNKRINRRVANEVERQKHLILTGLIPFSEAPAELWLHPVLVIDRYTNAIIAANRERKKKIPNIVIPDHEYNDPEPIPSTDLTISAGHHYNQENKTLLCDNHRITQEGDDIANGYTFTDEDFYKLFYMNPQIIAMKDLDTIEELYDKAEQILGPLKGLAPP
ncbi:uncharacterized protein LOC123305907 [Chrysoperla carnea]|uniref:uncharacterized protein LOC123305907 n=1 Tax=Chrysoperla carnea TaxID=189513 RepID=UPI001D07C480|nr:uncharacterized protein LOC123305907 [Chrysoperla carnea]